MIAAPLSPRKWCGEIIPTLKQSVVSSSVHDGERALLDLGTGKIVVVDDSEYRCMQDSADAPSQLLYEALDEAGFIEHADTVRKTR
ncbi:hypothetical protein J5J83_10720 [Azoarcus sp. L1K30]|uniref:hypothetical protein n=1 Tax=Azoarcus sp. L1K30 TaxID=2820277 RepID=UPI001B83470A|nr:hypothetical protein [Azoarcus sp. L1K30]MBR0566587.1 hypothetical protein [Azoarcus sp. L1K30]